MKIILKLILGAALVGGLAAGCNQKKEDHSNVSPGSEAGSETPTEDSKKPETAMNPELVEKLKSANNLLAQEMQVRQNLNAMKNAKSERLRKKLLVVFRARVENSIGKLNNLALDPKIKSDAQAKAFIKSRLDLLEKVKTSVIAEDLTRLFPQMEQLDLLFSQE